MKHYSKMICALLFLMRIQQASGIVAVNEQQLIKMIKTQQLDTPEETSKPTAGDYELSPELTKLIEQYEDPTFIEPAIEQWTREAEKYQHPDFIHRVTHPREANSESIDALNKTVIYTFPEYVRTPNRKPIGIFASDLIGVATQTAQWFVTRNSARALTQSLALALTGAVLDNKEQFITLLEQKNSAAVIKQLIETVWQAKTSTPMLSPYLKYRFTHAALEYFKKKITPPPFYIHGKTSEGVLSDLTAGNIAPISSILPLEVLESMIDPDLNGSLLISNQKFGWNNDYKGTRSGLLLNIASQYAVEGAKQLDFIGTIDEGLFFVIAKETATSMLFFHCDLKNLMPEMLEAAFNFRTEQLYQLLKNNNEAEQNLTHSAEERATEQKKCTQALESFFNQALQQREKYLISELKRAHRTYNTITNGLLLTPAVYGIGLFGWNLFKSMKELHQVAAAT